MADCSEGEDPDSMFRKRHATPPTPHFEADISPQLQSSAGYSAQATSFQSHTRGRTDERDLFANVKTRSKSPVYQVPSVKEWTPIQLSSGPSRFRPLKDLVPGALSETYTARHCVLRQNFVVKVVDLRSFVDHNSGIWPVHAEIQALRRIQRFGKSGLQQLSMFPFYPDIWCSNDAYLYFLLERYPYRLRQFENSMPMDEMLLGSIIFSIGTGLQELHNMGIIHTNVSLDSVFVDANGHCVIGEFGESIVLPTSKHLRGAKLTIEGETQFSTNLYTAPELLGGSTGYLFDESVDYWSLGLTIVTLVIGEKNLTGLKETFLNEVLQMDEIVREMRISLCPQSIVEVVSLLCQVDPGLRLGDRNILSLCRMYGWCQQDSEALLWVKPQLPHPRKRTSHRNQDVSERLNNPAEALELFEHFKNAVDLWMPKDENGQFLSAFEYLP